MYLSCPDSKLMSVRFFFLISRINVRADKSITVREQNFFINSKSH